MGNYNKPMKSEAGRRGEAMRSDKFAESDKSRLLNELLEQNLLKMLRGHAYIIHNTMMESKKARGGSEAVTSAKDEAKALLEAVTHPERFCRICGKRVGVCKHTKGRE